MPNGEVWKNLVIEEKTKPAETLGEFRASYKYNLLDRNLRAFNLEIPTFAQWDDHEVTNNWWPGEPLDRVEHKAAFFRRLSRRTRPSRAGRTAARPRPAWFETPREGRGSSP